MLSSPNTDIHSSGLYPSRNRSLRKGRALWRQFKKGNEAALSTLYKNHFKGLYNHGYYLCKDHELVLDCMQELFSRLWSKRETLADVDCVKIYLYKSFQRLLFSQLVGKRKSARTVTDALDFMPPFEDTLILGELKREQIKKLKKGIQSLSKGQREVILLKFFNDLTYPEISEIMEMRVDSVYNLTSKAIDMLRKRLQIPSFLSPLA